MKNRPFCDLPYSILESLFKASNRNVDLLLLLQSELLTREDLDSARLSGRVSQILELLEPDLPEENLEEFEDESEESNEVDDDEHEDDDEVVEEIDEVEEIVEEDEYFHCPACGNIPTFNLEKRTDRYENCQNQECNRVFYLAYDPTDSSMMIYTAEENSSNGIICIDFGTSSLRAAISDSFGANVETLNIGEFLGLTGGDYEIISNIYVSKDAESIYFGDEAYSKSKKSPFDASILESSPKKWMTLYEENFWSPIAPKTKLNRWHLLIGLISQSLQSIKLGLNISTAELKKYEIRISHPVWGDSWKEKRALLEKTLYYAIEISDAVSLKMSASELVTAIEYCEYSPDLIPHSDIDIVEPVAAAVELFQEDINARQVCAVIDIGAGTTDLGLFLSLTPDSRLDLDSNPYKRKFKSLAKSVSLNFAGDYIDFAILQLFKEKAKHFSSDQIKAFEIEIRDRKLEIFSRVGNTTFLGIDITYQELSESKYISILKNEISNAFSNMLLNSEEVLIKLSNLRAHYIREINLVFAGGGQGIQFIREAIPNQITLESGLNLPIVVAEANNQSSNLRLTIDLARLAVCRGGTTCADDWPNTNPEAHVIGPNDSGPWL